MKSSNTSAVCCLLLILYGCVCSGYWIKHERASKDALIPIRLALIQQNLDVLENTLLDVANPTSPNYGKWWTPSAVLDLVSPPYHISTSIEVYLKENGAINVENKRDMIKCLMSVSDIESTFQTSMFLFSHHLGKLKVIRTTEGYTVPEHLSRHVSFVAGLSEFFEVLSRSKDGTYVIYQPSQYKTAKVGNVDTGYITVAHLQQIYQIPSIWPNHPNSSIAVVEFQDDNAFTDYDMAVFEAAMGVPHITIDQVYGPFGNLSSDAESALDIQYGGSVSLNATHWFWTEEEWMYGFVTNLFDVPNPPLVVSMSWGWPEPNQCQIDGDNCNGTSYDYVDRVNVEFQKIGLIGITLIAASGDQGAPGDGDYGCDNRTNPLSTIFPGASPWVLSVGATMLSSDDSRAPMQKRDSPPICQQVSCATSLSEITCSFPDALITSGGGFSERSPRPSFQDAAVTSYLKSGVALPDASYFNGTNRGFPDVSALGHNYLIGYEEEMIQVDGTSASAPVVAAIIALLNSYRMNENKAPLGYVVPLVYAAQASNPSTFTDITVGDNSCTEDICCIGYLATAGWDPVTGLGTPQFPQLLKYVMNLQ